MCTPEVRNDTRLNGRKARAVAGFASACLMKKTPMISAVALGFARAIMGREKADEGGGVAHSLVEARNGTQLEGGQA